MTVEAYMYQAHILEMEKGLVWFFFLYREWYKDSSEVSAVSLPLPRVHCLILLNLESKS